MVLYPKDKIGLEFYIPKKTIRGGGAEVSMVKDHKFPDFFSGPLPLALVSKNISNINYSSNVKLPSL